MRITILGQTPSQKNGKVMAINHKTGKSFPISNAIVKDWQKSAATQLLQWKGQAAKRVTVTYMFFVKDNRPRDIDNMVASVNDALVKAGLVKDDSWQWLAIGAADAAIDKDKARCELWVEEDA